MARDLLGGGFRRGIERLGRIADLVAVAFDAAGLDEHAGFTLVRCWRSKCDSQLKNVLIVRFAPWAMGS